MSHLRGAQFLALVLALLLGAGATLIVEPGVAQPKPPERSEKPTLDELLDRFPIGTKPVRTTDQTSGRDEEAIVEQPARTGDDNVIWILLAGAGAMVLLVALGATALQRQRVRGSETVSSLSTSSLAHFHHALSRATERSPGMVEFPKYGKSRQPPADGAEYEPEATDSGTTRRTSRGTTAGANGPPPLSERDYDGFGKRVIGILEAAEAAAAQIQAEADDEAARIRAEADDEAARIRAESVDGAADIRKAAEEEAQVYLARAEQAASQVRSDAAVSAEEILSTADADSASRREEAEAEAQRILADAESQALAFHEAAAEKARQIQADTREREDMLRAQVQPLEENLRRALEAFRGMSAQLQELLADLPGSMDESLVDTLNESAKGAEARVER